MPRSRLAGGPIAYVSVLHSGALPDADRDISKLRNFGPPVLGSIEAKPYRARVPAALVGRAIPGGVVTAPPAAAP